MHILYEILAEGYEEEDSEETAEQRTEEHLPEIDLQAKDVDGRKGEDGAGHDHAGAGSDALDDDVLAEASLLAERAGDADREDGDGDGCLEHLAYLKSEVSSCCREQYGHQEAEGHRIRRNLERLLISAQQGFVAFPRVQFPVRVLRKAEIRFAHLFRYLVSSLL